MGKASRAKGAPRERKAARLLGCERVPLSGSQGGHGFSRLEAYSYSLSRRRPGRRLMGVEDPFPGGRSSLARAQHESKTCTLHADVAVWWNHDIRANRKAGRRLGTTRAR